MNVPVFYEHAHSEGGGDHKNSICGVIELLAEKKSVIISSEWNIRCDNKCQVLGQSLDMCIGAS